MNPELRDALNTKWNINILEPREGIGGHCLPKDTKMFLQKSLKSKILTGAMEVDEDYRSYRQSRDKQTNELLLLSYYFICPRSVTFNGCVPEAEGMGFQMGFFSSYDTDFNFDRHVSFTPEELAKKEAFFNFTIQDPHISEREGVSVFL
jgi:hypothetical protein